MKFQFLIGRLKTIEGYSIVDEKDVFQFLIGRLKTIRALEEEKEELKVSIPDR